jgi:hypothetical protein
VTTFTDSLDRPDGTMGGVNGWLAMSGATAHNINTNRAISQNLGSFLGTYQDGTPLATGDHRLVATDVNLNGTGFAEIGLWVRIPAGGAQNGYVVTYGNFGSPLLSLYQVNGGTFGSALDDAAVSGSGNHEIIIEVNASSVTVSFDAVPLLAGAAASYGANTRIGLEGYCANPSTPSIGSLFAEDIGGAAARVPRTILLPRQAVHRASRW